jgi:hypothetical protein
LVPCLKNLKIIESIGLSKSLCSVVCLIVGFKESIKYLANELVPNTSIWSSFGVDRNSLIFLFCSSFKYPLKIGISGVTLKADAQSLSTLGSSITLAILPFGFLTCICVSTKLLVGKLSYSITPGWLFIKYWKQNLQYSGKSFINWLFITTFKKS